MEPTVTPEVAVSPIVSLLFIAIGVCGLICWIMEIVAAFKKEEKPLMGILSIVLCSLGGFIIGWIHAKKWGISKLMLIWTIIAVIGVILNFVFAGAIMVSAPGN